MTRAYYHQLTLQDRQFIQKNVQNMPIRNIAQTLDISTQALYYEIKRCPKGQYNAYLANSDARQKREHGAEARRKGIQNKKKKEMVKGRN